MKIAAIISRYLLGLLFLFSGLNGLFTSPKMPSMGPTADQFLGAMRESHYLIPIFVLQAIPAVLFLINRYVPLALILIAPIIVNIVLFHALIAHGGLPVPLIVCVLWGLVAWWVRSAFAGILQQKVAGGTPLAVAPANYIN